MKRLSTILVPIEQVMERLRQVQADPEATDIAKIERLIEAYVAHGRPFGRGVEAAFVWGWYAQQTTQN